MNVGTLIASSDNNEIMSHGIYREVLSNILEISSGATKFNIMNFVSMIVLYYTSLIYQKTSKKIEVVVKDLNYDYVTNISINENYSECSPYNYDFTILRNPNQLIFQGLF